MQTKSSTIRWKYKLWVQKHYDRCFGSQPSSKIFYHRLMHFSVDLMNFSIILYNIQVIMRFTKTGRIQNLTEKLYYYRHLVISEFFYICHIQRALNNTFIKYCRRVQECNRIQKNVSMFEGNSSNGGLEWRFTKIFCGKYKNLFDIIFGNNYRPLTYWI